MSRPTPELFECARRVLGYLEKTEDVGLVYAKDSVPLHGMSDSDWGVRHSTTGWVFMCNGAAISWNSSKQPCVALSSCEAEIIAASDAAKEGKFWGSFLEETGFFVRDMVETLEIEVPFVRTDENIADFLTKPLQSKKFYAMRRVIMNEPDRTLDRVSHAAFCAMRRAILSEPDRAAPAA